MRFLGRAIFVAFLVLGVLIAVSNRQPVELGLWPLAPTIVLPLFLLVPALLLAGVLLGLLLAWLGGAGARRDARRSRREADRLRTEAEELRSELARERSLREQAAAARTTTASNAEQRTLERQAALVDPEAAVVAHRIGGGR